MCDIPDGWVPIARYDTRENKKSGGPVGQYRLLLHATKLGEIASMRMGKRRKYVRQVEADEYVRKWREGQHRTAATVPASDCGEQVTTFSSSPAFCRIADALEKIATLLETRGGA